MAETHESPLTHHGLNVSRDPAEQDATTGGPPKQRQRWPGSDRDLTPQADHGEQTYQGGGKLEGLKALITGGDSGIGRAVAIAFAREGADVGISYYNEHADAEYTLGWVRKAGRCGFSMAGDLREPQHAKELVQRMRDELGGIDLLVNNAAFHVETSQLEDITPERLDQTFRTNIYAYIWLAQAALPHLKRGSTIINSGSVVAMMPYPELTDYAATKAAIHNLTKNMAVQLAPRGIRVNCVAPGPVWTPLIASTRDDEFVGEFGADTLWNRPAQPAEMAPSYVFLASTDARFYSGDILCPSGYPISSG